MLSKLMMVFTRCCSMPREENLLECGGVDAVDGAGWLGVAEGFADEFDGVAGLDGDDFLGEDVAFDFHGGEVADLEDGGAGHEDAGVFDEFFEDGPADGRADDGFFEVAFCDGEFGFEAPDFGLVDFAEVFVVVDGACDAGGGHVEDVHVFPGGGDGELGAFHLLAERFVGAFGVVEHGLAGDALIGEALGAGVVALSLFEVDVCDLELFFGHAEGRRGRRWRGRRRSRCLLPWVCRCRRRRSGRRPAG